MNKDLKEKLIKQLKETKISADIKIPEFYLRIQNIINNCPEPYFEYLDIVLDKDKEKFANKIFKEITFTIMFHLSFNLSHSFINNSRNYLQYKYNYYDKCSFYGILLALDIFTNENVMYLYLKTQNIMKLSNIQKDILFYQIFYNEYLKIPYFVFDKYLNIINVDKSKKIRTPAQYRHAQGIVLSENHLHYDSGYQIYNSIIHELVHFAQYSFHDFTLYNLNYQNYNANIQYCDMQIRFSSFSFSDKYMYSKCNYVSSLSKAFYFITRNEIEANNISYKKTNDLMLNMDDFDTKALVQYLSYSFVLEEQFKKIKKRYHIDQLDNNTIQNEYNHAVCHLMYNENPESYLQAKLMYDVMNVIVCQDYIDAGLTFDEDRFELKTMNAVLEQYGFSKENFQ